MRIPGFAGVASLAPALGTYSTSRYHQRISALVLIQTVGDCPFFPKGAGCAASVAQCAASCISGVGTAGCIECFAALGASDCVDCLPN